MKKVRKSRRIRMSQKRLIILVMAIVIIILAIIFIVKPKNKEPEEQPNEFVGTQLPEITYSDMQVKNIVMELLKGNAADGSDQTMISFEIVNTTANKVENKKFEAVLMDSEGKEITRMPHNYIQELEVGEAQKLNVVYKGDLTNTTQIKLIEE